MRSGRYILAIITFFIFLTVLIIIIMPFQIGSANVTSYFSTPDGNTHYIQVPEGTNASAYIIFDNSGSGTYDLINYSIKASVIADLVLVSDYEMIYQLWIENFTLLKGNKVTIKLTFNATIENIYPGETLREFFIKIRWGEGASLDYERKLNVLKVGSTYEEEPFLSIYNWLIIFSAIGMGIMVFIIAFAAIKDLQHYRARHRPPRVQLYQPEIPFQPTFPPKAPISPKTKESIKGKTPIEKMELVPCPKCSSKIDKTQLICPNCGYVLPKCAICNLPLEEEDPIETCPECGAIGHREHFREWVHVKGYCPLCKKPLTF